MDSIFVGVALKFLGKYTFLYIFFKKIGRIILLNLTFVAYLLYAFV